MGGVQIFLSQSPMFYIKLLLEFNWFYSQILAFIDYLEKNIFIMSMFLSKNTVHLPFQLFGALVKFYSFLLLGVAYFMMFILGNCCP